MKPSPTDNVEKMPIDALIPYARNSRTHSDEQVAQIAASIKEWGFTTPVLVDEDGGIIAGHGRTLAARKLGMTEVPVLVARGWTDAQKRAYVIADNKLALNAGWDQELLRLELADLGDLEFDLGLVGFSDDELAALEPVVMTEGLTDEDAVPEVPEQPVTVDGDVWLLGRHRLMCGDSTSIDAVERLMAGRKANMLCTDPPYNLNMHDKNKRLDNIGKARKDKSNYGIKNDNMQDEQFRQFLIDTCTAADAVMNEGSIFYIFHADSEGYNFRGALRDIGWQLRQCLIWVKQVATLSKQDFNWQHEPILYGWKDGAAHYFCGDFTKTTVIDDDLNIKGMKRSELVELVNNMRTQQKTTVLRHSKPMKSDFHPTMKPVSLVQRMIDWSSKQKDIVLDLFGGSGSTLIACEKTARDCRLMELDPKYCDVIIKRWQDFTGQQATHEQTGKTFAEVSNGTTQAQ